MWIAPSEPPTLRALGTYSPVCEQHGADFLFLGPNGLMGCQRKTCSDLVASLQGSNGDRLGREMGQMQQLDLALLIVEGDWKWLPDGRSGRRGCHFSKARYRSLILTVQHNEGIHVVETSGVDDTAGLLVQYEQWWQDPDRRNLRGRPKPKDFNGPRDEGIHMLQGVKGVGVVQAAACYDHYGRVPLTVDTTETELRSIKGWGPVRAKTFMEAFNG